MAFNIQLEFSSGRKRFAIKTMAPLERAGKNLSIYVLGFVFKDTAYDYERVKQRAFYAKKAPRALGGPFLLDAPIYILLLSLYVLAFVLSGTFPL